MRKTVWLVSIMGLFVVGVLMVYGGPACPTKSTAGTVCAAEEEKPSCATVKTDCEDSAKQACDSETKCD